MRAIIVVSVALLSALFSALTPRALLAQQVADTLFRPEVAAASFELGRGPRLCLDEAHHNFHTLTGRFAPFGALARRDGYGVSASRAPFTAASLAACDLLVIANAQPSAEPWTRYPYPTPSAFSEAEIAAVYAWVERGGALMLIADHMPLAGAAASLATAFGAFFTDGFAYPALAPGTPVTSEAVRAQAGRPTLFRVSDGSLAAHAIVSGRDAADRVSQIQSFTGQAFRFDAPDVEPLMILPADYVSFEPRVAWVFTETTAVRPVGGWLQGATRRVGAGRIAVFGEAAMFSAQLAGPAQSPMGMNAPLAAENARFALNVLRWLIAR